MGRGLSPPGYRTCSAHKQKTHSAGEWVDSFPANFAYRNAPRHLDESQVNRYQRYELARMAFMTGIVYFFSFPDTTNSFSSQPVSKLRAPSEKKHCNAIARESR